VLNRKNTSFRCVEYGKINIISVNIYLGHEILIPLFETILVAQKIIPLEQFTLPNNTPSV
jgi:hypothetical protein